MLVSIVFLRLLHILICQIVTVITYMSWLSLTDVRVCGIWAVCLIYWNWMCVQGPSACMFIENARTHKERMHFQLKSEGPSGRLTPLISLDDNQMWHWGRLFCSSLCKPCSACPFWSQTRISTLAITTSTKCLDSAQECGISLLLCT